MFIATTTRGPKAGGNPKPEGRRPKEGRNPKAEGRNKFEPRSALGFGLRISTLPEKIVRPWRIKSKGRKQPEPRSGFGLRISVFGLLSAFGLRPSDFKAAFGLQTVPLADLV